jgi:hypothetical protein
MDLGFGFVIEGYLVFRVQGHKMCLFFDPQCQTWTACEFLVLAIQVYLAHKKSPTPLRPP